MANSNVQALDLLRKANGIGSTLEQVRDSDHNNAFAAMLDLLNQAEAVLSTEPKDGDGGKQAGNTATATTLDRDAVVKRLDRLSTAQFDADMALRIVRAAQEGLLPDLITETDYCERYLARCATIACKEMGRAITDLEETLGIGVNFTDETRREEWEKITLL